MTSLPIVLVNSQGSYYDKGKSFSTSKWHSIAQKYFEILEIEGKCTVRKLAKATGISVASANKAIVSIQTDNKLPVAKKVGIN